MKISVIGTGYVGLGTAAIFADLGNDVIGADMDQQKVDDLNKGIMPIYEPGLKEIVVKNYEAGRLKFTSDNKEAIDHGDIIFICVGTPPKDNWETELGYVEQVAKEIAQAMTSYKVIVHKSTVPVQTGIHVRKIIEENIKDNVEFDVVSNPEFLREGTAIDDSFNPDRIVIGSESERATKLMKELYEPIKAPVLVTDIQSAELIKHASNSFLATKISFINALAQLCEKTGADVELVAEGMGMDKRISKAFLNAGIGYGGFCFPKDVQAFIKIAEKLGYDFSMLKATNDINEKQKDHFVDKIKDVMGDLTGKTIGVLGLAFKPNTDDMRFAPSVLIIKSLQQAGATIKAYDPEAMKRAKDQVDVELCEDAYDVMKDADALVMVTEWDEFRNLDLDKAKSALKNPLVFDGRNMYNPEDMKKAGIQYHSIGRGSV